MASERLLATKLTNRRKESESGRDSDRLMWAKLYGKSRVELSRSVTGRSPVRPPREAAKEQIKDRAGTTFQLVLPVHCAFFAVF